MLSIFWNQWFFKMSVNIIIVIGCSWWWNESCWGLWVDVRFDLNVKKVIAVFSVIWNEWFLKLGINKLIIVSSGWWWNQTSWRLWVDS